MQRWSRSRTSAWGFAIGCALVGGQGCFGCENPDPELLPEVARRDTFLSPLGPVAEVGTRFSAVLEISCGNCDPSEEYEIEVEVPRGAPVRLVSATQSPGSLTPVEHALIGTEVSRIKMRAPAEGAGGRVDLVFSCDNVGEARVKARFVDYPDDSSLDARCIEREAGTDAGSRGVPKEFANGVGELVTVSRSGPGWIFTVGGVTTNLGQRTPELASKFTPIGDDCERFEGATTFPSDKGPDKLDAETSLQKGAASFDGTQIRYVWSGFEVGGVFGSIDSVKFRWNGLEQNVPAPPPFGAPDTVLSAPAGDQTMFYVPAGEADAVTVFGQLAPGSGYTCRFRVMSLRVDVGRHAAPLVPPEVKAEIPNVMDVLQNVFVAKVNERRTTDLFPGNEHALDAARMLRIPRTALDP